MSTTTRQVDACTRPGRFDAATEARLADIDRDATPITSTRGVREWLCSREPVLAQALWSIHLRDC
ncbi:hypothetical protein [Streptomyces sp. NPDC000994]